VRAFSGERRGVICAKTGNQTGYYPLRIFRKNQSDLCAAGFDFHSIFSKEIKETG
jgi:hypothetical protein